MEADLALVSQTCWIEWNGGQWRALLRNLERPTLTGPWPVLEGRMVGLCGILCVGGEKDGA